MVAISQAVEVLIVGAGLSGLRAATDIHEAGLSYVVLEAMDRVGGKTLSVPSASNNSAPLDLGAAWINNSTQSEIFALSKRFGFDLIVQRTEGNSLFQTAEGDVSSNPFNMPFPASDDQLAEVQQLIDIINKYVERSDLENPHLGPDAEELDALTALEFVKENLGTDVSELAITGFVRAILGVEADELSALYLVDYIKSGTGLANLAADTADGGQYLRNRQGNQQFSINLAKQLKHKSVKLSTAVTKITQTDDGCIIETNKGTRYSAKKVIISVPTSLYSSIEFVPELPDAKKELSETTKLGYWSKTILVFKEPWWRAANLSGAFLSVNGPIILTRDTSVDEDDQYSIATIQIGQPGRDWSELDAEDRRQAVLEQFRTAFGTVVNDIPEPINIIEKEWSKDPWALGAPSPVMVPGIMTKDAGKSIRDPVGNLHFIGTETSHVWKGYLEGAVRSGVRGANEVITALED